MNPRCPYCGTYVPEFWKWLDKQDPNKIEGLSWNGECPECGMTVQVGCGLNPWFSVTRLDDA